MKNEIPIFFAVDDGYIPFLNVTIQSIIENSSKEYKYNIKILQELFRFFPIFQVFPVNFFEKN